MATWALTTLHNGSHVISSGPNPLHSIWYWKPFCLVRLESSMASIAQSFFPFASSVMGGGGGLNWPGSGSFGDGRRRVTWNELGIKSNSLGNWSWEVGGLSTLSIRKG